MRYTNIINKIKENKRILYLSFCIVLILFSLVLNITFSLMTKDNNASGANIVIGDLKYQMIINEVELNESVGTKLPSNTIIGDRIILLKAGLTEQFEINLISKNNIDTKYEITYKVCTDVNCTNFIDTPNTIEIAYHKDTPDVSGIIKSGKSKSITLVTDNQSENNYYVQVNLNVGYSHNELALTNQITSQYKLGSLEGNLSIIAYVDGKEVSGFPSTSGYIISSSTCETNGSSDDNIEIKGYFDWINSKWVINVNNISSSGTVCNINFETAPLLAEAIRKNYPTISAPKTTPGSAVSTASEAVLAATTDDYGTSYYFRGAVTNNYVQFANKCWRIVRITGNGAIKLVLHNDNVNNVSNPCNASNNDKNAAFARHSGTIYVSVFNSSYVYNAYVGFMYGTPNSSTYAAEHANKEDSIVFTKLKTWYNTYIKSYADKLADVIYCGDKSTNSGVGYGINVTTYSISKRTTTPTLVCPYDNLGSNLSKYTSEDTVYGNGALNGYKVGLLSADEIEFAGGGYETINKSYYLYENASGTIWWTLTPYGMADTSYASVMGVLNDGAIHLRYVVDDLAVRPSIALIPTIQISMGTGTSSDPFVVN